MMNLKNKCSAEQLKQALGTGIVLPVAYDTAWLARVPDHPDTTRQAFPHALDHLRAHQFEDGSWGSQIYNAHGNLLSTLAAIIAFTQWGRSDDHSRIEKGLQALTSLAENLSKESYETIGFEMLLPALCDECHALNIQLPHVMQRAYEVYQAPYLEKLKLIEKQMQKMGSETPASWWFNLEILGFDKKTNHLDVDVNEKMLSPEGSVAASPAASAYLLTTLRHQNKDVPKAHHFLETLAQKAADHSSLPNVYPIDEFEISFAANYCFDAGISADNPLLMALIKRVACAWEKREKGGLGYSSHFFIDPDCSANGLRALMLGGYHKKLTPSVLLDFFNGDCIETYAGERNPSVSTNIHTLLTLRHFEEDPHVQNVIATLVAWLEKMAHQTGPVFVDKWHFSPIYPTSRAVIALAGSQDALAQRCVDWLLQQQREDGSWGMQQSTLEETALASLSLAHWHQRGHIIDEIVFQKAAQFLNKPHEVPQDTLWIGKTLYCPQNVVCAMIYAANFALNNVLSSDEKG